MATPKSRSVSVSRTMKTPMKKQKAPSGTMRARTGAKREMAFASKLATRTPASKTDLTGRANAMTRGQGKKLGLKKMVGPENAVAGIRSKVRARPGTTVYKAQPISTGKLPTIDRGGINGKASTGFDLGKEIQSRIDLITGKTKSPISRAMEPRPRRGK